MPAFAPRSSVQAELRRAQAARQEHHGERITLGGRSYLAEVTLGEIQHVPTEDGGGWEKLQKIRVVIFKDQLSTAPGKKTLITHNGVEYLIMNTAAAKTLEPAWVIRGERRSPAAA